MSAFAVYRSQRLLLDAATPGAYLLFLFGVLLVLALAESTRQRRSLEGVVQSQREQSARIAGELEAAKLVQTSSLPRPDFLRSDGRVDLYAAMTPAREVGGDLYDFFMLDEDRLFLLIGDVSGKGLSASIFMAVSKALYKGLMIREPDADIGDIMNAANAEVSRDNAEMFFVTLFAAILDLHSGELNYCNAGHDNPYLAAAGRREPERIVDGDGPPLCVMTDFDYRSGRRRLAPGEVLCLLTDGIFEAQNPAGALYGHERAQAVIVELVRRDASASELGAALQTDALAFADGAEPNDDLTILALRWKGPSPGTPIAASLGSRLPRDEEQLADPQSNAARMDFDHACTVRARMECLAEAIAFVESFCDERGVAHADSLRLSLIVEELFTNTVTHGYAGDSDAPVRIALRADASDVELSFEDMAPPFDPLQHVPPPIVDVESDSLARPVGQLGIALVVSMATAHQLCARRRLEQPPRGLRREVDALARRSAEAHLEQRYDLTCTDLMLTNSRMPKLAHSRPKPECLTPPNGMRGSERTLSLTKARPASSSSAAMRSPRCRSRVRTPEPRPNSLALAIAMASVSSRASMIAATGPNTSSSCAGCPATTFVSTVGGYHAPRCCGTTPPSSSRAPRANAGLHLRVDLVARRHALQRPQLRRGVARVARLVCPHRLDERLLECGAHRANDDEALAGDAALAAVDHPCGSADLRRRGDVGVLENDVGVRPAELQHALLQHAAGDRGDAAAGGDAARQRDRRDMRVLDQRADSRARHEHGGEQMLGEAGLAKHRFDRQRAARDVARVLENPAVARHQRR